MEEVVVVELLLEDPIVIIIIIIILYEGKLDEILSPDDLMQSYNDRK